MTDPVRPEIYAQIFEDDRRGAAIFEELVLRFSKPAVTKGGIDAVLQTYHHEGQRSVVQFIVAKINQAHGVQHVDDETGTDGAGG